MDKSAIFKRAREIATETVEATDLKGKMHTQKYAYAWEGARITAIRFLRGDIKL